MRMVMTAIAVKTEMMTTVTTILAVVLIRVLRSMMDGYPAPPICPSPAFHLSLHPEPFALATTNEPQSKLLVSPMTTPGVVLDVIPYMTPQFRLQPTWSECRTREDAPQQTPGSHPAWAFQACEPLVSFRRNPPNLQ